MIKLIAVDLDGTVVRHDLSISRRVVDSLVAARDQGAFITIATGRGPSATRAYARLLGVNAPVICTQGGVVHDMKADQELLRISLSSQLTVEALRLAQAHTSWQPVLYLHDRIHVTMLQQSESFYREMLVPEPPVVVPDLEHELGARNSDKVLFVVEPDDAQRAVATLRAHFGARASVVQSHAKFVEVNPALATKGAGLAFLASHLGVRQAEVLAIGDQENDVTMLTWAGIGVAMGNGSPSAKAAANWTAPDIANDGVAHALEKYVLNTR